MGRYVFYRKELFPMNDRPESVYSIMRDTFSYWQHEHPEESKYVAKHAIHLETKVQRNPENYSIITIVVGTMCEKDYVLYRLKY